MEKYRSNQSRLIIVANRLPFSVSKRKEEFKIQQSPGGLATGLRSLQQGLKVIFIGWPGIWPENEREKRQIELALETHQSYPVFISPGDFNQYYYGFANKALWPLFHYFSTYCTFEETEWKAYERINQKFLQKVYELGMPEDFIWIHDYHLMLLPGLVRKSLLTNAVGFFLHIPFPSSEIFRLLPWREQILKGLLGSDLIGFHTYEYARHFMSSVLRLLGHEHEFGDISFGERVVRVENFPMGIDVQYIEKLLESPSVQKEIKNLKETLGPENRKIILSVDRLDYTKGIPQRLLGVEKFLEKNPEWHNRFIYIMLSVPSRTRVSDYSLLKDEVERLVGRINGRFGKPGWMPIHYLSRSLPFEKLPPLYSVADVALITPLRDGMNLVAKEYVAARQNESGVLILSETAGAAEELGEALIVNVNNKDELANALARALAMDDPEQKRVMSLMRNRLLTYNISRWAESFVERLQEVKKIQSARQRFKLTETWQKRLVSAYQKGRNCLFLLDYDGTLVPFSKKPEEAKPDASLLRMLRALAKVRGNTLVIVSGRDRLTLDSWFGRLPCGLVAEHGAWIKRGTDENWEKQKSITWSWKEELRPILETYKVRVPGSLVEEKEFGMAWHYRNANPELGKLRSGELFDYLSEFLANTDLQVMQGNKVIEVRVAGINKGTGVIPWISRRKWSFILAAGDDWTDEDLFRVLPPSAYSVKIGYGHSRARFYLDSPATARDLVHALSKKKMTVKRR